jgi:hypothetical protein
MPDGYYSVRLITIFIICLQTILIYSVGLCASTNSIINIYGMTFNFRTSNKPKLNLISYGREVYLRQQKPFVRISI